MTFASQRPGIPNFGFRPPQTQALPAFRGWTHHLLTYHHENSTQKYLLFKRLNHRNDSSAVIQERISDLIFELIAEQIIDDHEASSICHHIQPSRGSPAFNLLQVQFHLTDECIFCALAEH